ncbi:MAG TPA: GGDEF domain-containing protein [bacterium]|nr:GGDEF domain-containing protein [bacterium]
MAEDEKTAVRDIRSLFGEQSSPEKREVPYFIVIAGGTVGMMYKLTQQDTYIGRATDAEIRVDDEGVSRKHARVSTTPNQQVIIIDLGSTNGTYVNGQKVAEQVLRDGDKVQIGSTTVLKFSYQDALEESFQRKLFDSAVKDGLTGIYNKKYFVDRLETDFPHAKRHRANLTLMIFDIDHFKKINDTHGHPAGDHCLRELAGLIKKTLRNEDVFARFGGEEFVILTRDVDDTGALVLAERIRRLVEGNKFVFEGKTIPVTISVGISTMTATSNPPFTDAADMVNRADQYLYKAKRSGRNRVEGKAVE